MRYLGIDYGTKRIGLALSDEGGRMAFPLEVIENNRAALDLVVEICRSKKVEKIIIGESKDFRGNDNPVMMEIKKFIENLTARIRIPIEFEAEFLTSRQAEHIQGAHAKLDASAAAIILQSYLEKQRHKKLQQDSTA